MTMEQLKVSCRAFNGIATDGYLPLDSILADVWMREHFPNLYYHNSVGAKDNFIDAELPLLKIDNGHGWYYACSFVEVEWVANEMVHWHKRHTGYEQRRYIGSGKINLSQGATKAYRMPLFTLHAGSRLTWYLVGERKWLLDRLSFINAIGKKHNSGRGIVCDWKIERMIEDYSIWKGDRLMRAIPIDDVPKDRTGLIYRVGHYGLRPAYWYSPYQMNLAMPIMEAAPDGP